ncbi:MAG: dihydrofolate reductase [Flavobacteriaceae bacterium]|nr:dihydrofolate reductase [Flavobacteriaceae bacterium]
MQKPLIIISALAKNHAIGINNTLPWRLPNDMKRFKQLTYGFPMIMGRKTYESMRGMLPGRKHIVMTHKEHQKSEKNLVFVNDIDSAIKETGDSEKAYIIGGSFIYALFMDIATHMELTHIHHRFEKADTFFPTIDYSQWVITQQMKHPIDEKHAFHFTYKTYQRI